MTFWKVRCSLWHYGGGTFVTQNKTIPGAYINFVTTATGATVFGERGVVALGDSFNWGSNDIFEVTAEDFIKTVWRCLAMML